MLRTSSIVRHIISQIGMGVKKLVALFHNFLTLFLLDFCAIFVTIFSDVSFYRFFYMNQRLSGLILSGCDH